MKRGLPRLLEVRRLLEERASLDLQRRAADLNRLEEEAEKQRALASQARGDALRPAPSSRGADSWLATADAEIFSWRRRRMETMAHQVSDEVADLRVRRMTRRMERRQVEELVLELEKGQKQQQTRREQQLVDEWFPKGQRSRSPE